MANIANIEKSSPIIADLGAPLFAFGALLVRIAEASPRMQRLEELNGISDAEFEALATTREVEMRRAIGVSAYL